MKKYLILPALILSTLTFATSARANNYKEICQSGKELTDNQKTLCLQWTGYVDNFESGTYDLPQQAPSNAPIQSYGDALAVAQQWRSQEGFTAVQQNNFDSPTAQNWCGANFHNNQTCRRLSGEGPIEMPSSLREVSSNAGDIILSGGPLGLSGNPTQGDSFPAYAIIMAIVVLLGIIHRTNSSNNSVSKTGSKGPFS